MLATSSRMLVRTSADRLTLREGLPRITRIRVAAMHLFGDVAGMSELGELALESEWPMARAFELQAEGQQIEVITVYDFLAMLTDVRGH